jgi:hypothetical protein
MWQQASRDARFGQLRKSSKLEFVSFTQFTDDQRCGFRPSQPSAPAPVPAPPPPPPPIVIPAGTTLTVTLDQTLNS